MTKPTVGKSLLGVLMLGAFLVPVFTDTAKADDRDWRMHEMRAHRWHQAHPVVVPGYVYAPPVIVAPPPPPPPGINLVIPLNFH